MRKRAARAPDLPDNALDWQWALIHGRRDAKLSLICAAEAIGIHPDTLANWERARNMPTVENLRAALNCYGWTIRFEKLVTDGGKSG